MSARVGPGTLAPGAAGFVPRFRAIVRARPNAIALEGCGAAWTYRELDARACGIAAALREAGAGRESLVGLCFDKGPEYVAALLGTWYAGAAFVPLDPRLPAARLEFLVRDGGIRWVVAQNDCRGRFSGLRVLGAAGTAGDGPVAEPEPGDLAYVIYTSGTTGEPKGVMVPHRGLTGLFDAQIAAFALDGSSRAWLVYSTSFDASLSDIGTALLAGATLCLGPESHDLAASLRANWITHVDLPPALLRVLDPASMPPTLRTVVIGGEAGDPEAVRRWAARFRVVNVYGPTEATICASLCVCDAATWARPLLGRPIPGVFWRIHDLEGRPVPPGLPGELVLGGAGLARGYLGRPEETAERFVARDGVRLFRTGDRVVELANGDVEFLGRFDRQIKVRGLRIEPGEIEAQLRKHPGVTEAAVVRGRVGASAGRSRPVLAAYVVGEARGEELRERLAATLPPWMVPARIVRLERLPRTARGKIDYAALAAYRADGGAAGEGTGVRTPPATAEERVLRELFREVLGMAEVFGTDDFFACGGDSIGAVQVAAAGEARGLPLSPAQVWQHRTPAGLAAGLRATADAEAMDAAELRRDAREMLGLAPRRPEPPEGPPRTVFFTGATGFLGARMLDALRAGSDARFLCLVRAADARHGVRRLREHVHGDVSRLTAVCGTLERERFGLAPEAWDELCHSVDTVIHCGARVNLALPYADLRPANVGGTREVLRLAGEGAPKRLHHVSTLSVFVATDRNAGPMAEADDLSRTRRVWGGYAQSKFAAEELVRAAGATAWTYRLGLITGDSRTGAAPDDGLLSLFLRGIVALGCLPEDAPDDLRMDVTPVDHAAAVLAHLVLHAPAATYHVANPRSATLGELLEAVRACGHPVRRASAAEWRARLAECERGAPECAAWLALCRGLAGGTFGRQRAFDLFQATGAEFRAERTLAALAESGIACPPPTPELLRALVHHALRREAPR